MSPIFEVKACSPAPAVRVRGARMFIELPLLTPASMARARSTLTARPALSVVPSSDIKRPLSVIGDRVEAFARMTKDGCCIVIDPTMAGDAATAAVEKLTAICAAPGSATARIGFAGAERTMWLPAGHAEIAAALGGAPVVAGPATAHLEAVTRPWWEAGARSVTVFAGTAVTARLRAEWEPDNPAPLPGPTGKAGAFFAGAVWVLRSPNREPDSFEVSAWRGAAKVDAQARSIGFMAAGAVDQHSYQVFREDGMSPDAAQHAALLVADKSAGTLPAV